LLAATLLFTFFIFKPFWVVLVLGVSFSIVLHPLYEWFKKRHLPGGLSAFLTVCLFTLVLCGPLLGIGAIVFNQSQNAFQMVVHEGNTRPVIDSINHVVNKILPPMINFDLTEKLASLASYVSDNIANIFRTTVSAFFSFILMLLIIFYFLKDGDRWRKAIIVLSPLGDKDDEKIITKLGLSVNAVIKGYLFIALIQGIMMGFGLWIFQVPNPGLWGVVAAVCSLLPTIGTALVSIPAIIFLFATGNTGYALGLLIWSIFIVGMIDNFLNPLIVGKKIDIPPFLILFSVLGGISFLGPVGVLVGPLTVSLLYTLISIYRNEFKQNSAF
jgi:predicted PurR-regulated permease PerM